MTRKLDLATLHEKEKEISQEQMLKVTSGIDTDPSDSDCNCESILTKSDIIETTQYRNCGCGSIWVVFGLTWG